MRVKYEDNTSPDIAQAAQEGYIVVLQLGCIEQHGPHLPVGCDYGRPIDAAERAAEKHGAGVLVLPTLPYGTASEHTSFPGTISLSFHTWSRVVVEIVDNLVRDGFRRIVVAKGCGGHMGIEGPLYEYYCNRKRQLRDLDIRIFGEQAWAEIGKVVEQSDIDQPPEVHAGAVETSGMMATRPELVHLDRLGEAPEQGDIRDGTWWLMEDISEAGFTGDPTQYDTDVGRAIAERMTEAFADFLGEMWSGPSTG